MPDPDLKRFQAELERTRPGMRLRLAIHESNIAVKKIRALRASFRRSTNLASHSDVTEGWRRAYIAACNRASMAIDDLWNQHQWPEDGARNRYYEWRPAKGFKRKA